MSSRCPHCHVRLSDFAVSCEKCGWSMIEQAGNAGNNPDEDIKLDESTIQIVKTSAKTEPPPSPIDNSSDDLAKDFGVDDFSDDLPPLEVDLHLQKAMEFIEQENFTSALSYLNRAIIDVLPERLAECFSLRGYVQLKNLDFSRAESDCSQAISQGWEDAQTYAWRAAARGEQNKWRSAFDDLEKAAELAGNQRDQYLNLMESYAETASEYFRELIKSGNESADLFFERGWIYLRSGKYRKAERDFKQAVEVQSNHPWASVGLAMLKFEKGKYEGVIDLCSMGAHGDEECERQSLKIRAQVKKKEGRISSAQRDLERLILLAGDDSQLIVECCRLIMDLGDHVKAIEKITKVLKNDPEHYLARMIRGDGYRAIKNYPLAIEDYTYYLRFYPTDGTALIRRAEMYLATDRLAEAHIDLNEAMETEKTNFDAYLVRSKVLLKENKLDQALGDCQKAVRLENQEPEVFAVLAEIYVKLCEYQRAIEEYSRAVEIAGPDHSKAHYLYHRGATFYQLNDFENARKDFKEACRLRPNHSGSWIWQAASSARLEKWSSAIVGLQQAIASRPSATEQYLKLGQPVAEKAIVFFDRQQQRKQDTVETYRQRGLAYQFLEQNQDAIKDFTTALNQDQDHQATLVRRGQAYAEVGEHDLAVKDFTRVIKLNPDNHEARYHRAISRTWQKKFDEGRSDLIKAIKVAPNDPKYYLQLAEIMQKVGDQDKMMEYANKAVMQDPTDPNSYSKRGHAQMICGNHLNAVSDFTHSLELNPSQLDVIVSRGQAYLKAEFPKLAIKDFELALTHDERLVKAYSGRANAMVIEGKMEQALIWLTKAIHRFETPRQLSEILFARGKAFYQMGRFAPAASDFTAVIDLMRSDTKTVAAARFARALTNIQSGKLEKVQKDFRRLLKLSPNDKRLQESLTWIEHPDPAAKPKLFEEKIEPVRPTRPTVKRAAVELAESKAKWQNDPPYDSWIVRNEEKKEYGPVRFNILKTWISDGRVDIGMRVLRSDWSKWKRAEKIFPELSPVGSGQSEVIEEFPELDIRKKSAEPN